MGLGLATVYLMKQKMEIQGVIEEAKAKFEGKEPDEAPATKDGVSSATVRKVIGKSDDRFRDVSDDLPKGDVTKIATMEDQLALEIAAFEGSEQTIRGHWMPLDHEA